MKIPASGLPVLCPTAAPHASTRTVSRFGQGVVLAAGFVACAGYAADFPARPVRMVVPIGPGSSMDITARVLGQKLNEMWERPVVIDNRPGAGSSVGAERNERP